MRSSTDFPSLWVSIMAHARILSPAVMSFCAASVMHVCSAGEGLKEVKKRLFCRKYSIRRRDNIVECVKKYSQKMRGNFFSPKRCRFGMGENLGETVKDIFFRWNFGGRGSGREKGFGLWR